MTYLSDVVALGRKDLRVELRGKDTLPAMLLFVLSTPILMPSLLLLTSCCCRAFEYD